MEIRTQYLVRVHPLETKKAQAIAPKHPLVVWIRKDRQLHEIYGSDDKTAMEDFAQELTGYRNIKRG